MSPLVDLPKERQPIVSLTFYATKENLALIKELRVMAAKDGWSLSQLFREALKEYHARHSPGNPQLSMGHWTNGEPLPKTLQKSHRSKSKSELFEEMTARLVRRARGEVLE